MFTGMGDQRLIGYMQAHLKSGKPKYRYHSYTFKGGSEGLLQAWLGIYPTGRDMSLRFLKVDENRRDLDLKKACRAVQSFLRAGSTVLQLKAPTSIVHPGIIDETLMWREAREQALGDGLPICFVTFSERASTFYYTRLLPTQAQWVRLRGMASREVLRHR